MDCVAKVRFDTRDFGPLSTRCGRPVAMAVFASNGGRQVFRRLFGGKTPEVVSTPAEPLVIVPIPPLVTILVALEKEKGASLSEQEVLRARDGAVCMTMRASAAHELAAKRGYRDLDPENIWDEWCEFLKS